MRTFHRMLSFNLLVSALIIAGLGTEAGAQEGAEAAGGSPWSEPATWPEGAVPADGDTVIIGEDMDVVLDVSPPPLAGLTIHGSLSFADDADIELTSEWILVHGELEVGSAASPHTRKATITLTDSVPGEQVSGMGDRGIMVVGGTLRLHGDRQNTWTQLAETAEAGSREINVLDANGWRAGDVIVLASTDFDYEQAEKRRIAAIDDNTITLDRPLEYMHFGEITFGVDERGEVGLLTRNIRIRASDDAEASYFGGHVMAMASSRMYVSGVEFQRMGQHMQLARYPIHWHLVGDASGQYVKNSAIHDTYSRCVTVHGTHNLLVQNNVAYNNVGHCYFMEDAIETGNELIGNLGVSTKCHPTKPCNPTNAFKLSMEGQQADDVLIPSDNTVSTFWITNPDNVIRGNVAAGSEQIGFWLAFPEHPTGEFEGTDIGKRTWPRRTQLREFTGNVAHSTFDGLMFDRGPSAEGTFNVAGNTHMAFADPADTNSEQLITVVEDFTGYKNRNAAFWGRGENHIFRNLKLADNAIGYTHAFPGLEPGGGAFTSKVVDSLFVGETDNVGTPTTDAEIAYGRSLPNPHADYPIRGFEYYDFGHELKNVTFRNYEDNDTREAGAISYLLFSNFPISTENSLEDLTFENAKPVHFPDVDQRWAFEFGNEVGYSGAVFKDKDGSLGGPPGSYVVINNGIATDTEACEVKPTWNAAICEGDFGRLWLRASDGKPGTGPFNQTTGGTQITLSRNGRQLVTGKPGFFGPGFGNTTVKSGTRIRATTDSTTLDLNLNELDDGSWVLFELPGFATATAGEELDSLDALRSATETSYYSDDDALWVKVVIAENSNGAAPFPPFGGGADVRVSK